MNSLLKLFILAVSLGIGFFNVSVKAQPKSQKDLSEEDYVVKYGDTLRGIAGRYLESPEDWRKLQKENPAIKNPHRIYPGDTLGYSGAWSKRVGGERGFERLAKPWYGLPIEKPVEVPPFRPPPLIVSSVDEIESAGFLVPERAAELKLKKVATIINSEEGKLGLTFGDLIYVNRGRAQQVKPGDILVAYRIEREVFHPITSQFIGTLIKVLGRVKIDCLEENISCAEIVKTYDYMQQGDELVPASELSIPYAKPPVGDSKTCCLMVNGELQAFILTEKEARIGITANDIVYLDVGALQGVQPGDQFIIYRKIGEGYPKRALGRLVILSVQENTATALVTESIKMIEVGERVTLKR
jgi:hypothetical protein